MNNSVQASGAKPADKDRVLIFDTTLRDGEQCPGATMTFEAKLEVAHLLDTMGVDIIEAGFPIASEGDFEAVSEIAKRAKRARVAGLARAIERDIARAGEAVRHAAAAAHPHLRFDLADPSRTPDEQERRGRARDHRQDGDAGA